MVYISLVYKFPQQTKPNKEKLQAGWSKASHDTKQKVRFKLRWE